MKQETNRFLISISVFLARILAGGLFVFSGFVKAIDPWGTLYKVRDYISVFSLELWPNLVIAFVFALGACEFLLGVFLLFGCFRRSSPIVGLGFMAFLLPLTLWIAIYSPVEDCGCFGDALIISNWATFWKNVVLTLLLVWLFFKNKLANWIITPALQWIFFVVSGIFIVLIEVAGYNYQPLIDFRPYKKNSYLVPPDYLNQDVSYNFIYQKDGQQKIFSQDEELPDEDSGWEFVDRIEIGQDKNTSQSDKDDKSFSLFSLNGEDDETEEGITEEGEEVIIMMPEIGKVSPAMTWRLNSLYEWAEKNGVKMIGVASASSPENRIKEWIDLSMAEYPIYLADDVAIKEVVRGNPGVVVLTDGKIVGKITLKAINIEDFLTSENTYSLENFGMDEENILYSLVVLYLVITAFLMALSFIPKISKLFIRHDDKVPH